MSRHCAKIESDPAVSRSDEHLRLTLKRLQKEIDRLDKELLDVKEQLAKQRLKHADQVKDLRKLVDLVHKRIAKK